MKHTNSLLWGSVSILIGIVISILALVRGVWQVPLLITAFAVWGLYLIFILLIPLLRSNRELRRRERRAERGRQALEDANLSVTGVTDRLLRDVSFRISDYLKSAFPNVRWEWAVEFPAEFAEKFFGIFAANLLHQQFVLAANLHGGQVRQSCAPACHIEIFQGFCLITQHQMGFRKAQQSAGIAENLVIIVVPDIFHIPAPEFVAEPGAAAGLGR